LDPNFGIGGITESRGKMICGIVVHPDPVDPLITGLLNIRIRNFEFGSDSGSPVPEPDLYLYLKKKFNFFKLLND
jgi:hypothetical protein